MAYSILTERPYLFGGLLLDLRPQEAETSVIERAIKRNPAAFTKIYDRYVDRIYHFVFCRVMSKSDSEDITQEVFIRAWKNIHKFQERGRPFAAWLFAIARNLITDHHRGKKALLPLDDVIDSAEDVKINLEKAAEDSFDHAHLRRAITKLKGDKQKVIAMRFFDGYSYAEIAKMMKKSEGAVRVVQYRALQDLRRILTKGK